MISTTTTSKASLTFLFVLLFASSVLSTASGLTPCEETQFNKLVKDYNPYSFSITTKDGYENRVYSISKKIDPKKPLIFLQHGFMDSSNSWVINSDEASIAKNLANKGYHVLLGNHRGNMYSLGADKALTETKKKDYWDYGFQDMAKFDIPAALDRIHKKFKKKIVYIGHS